MSFSTRNVRFGIGRLSAAFDGSSPTGPLEAAESIGSRKLVFREFALAKHLADQGDESGFCRFYERRRTARRGRVCH